MRYAFIRAHATDHAVRTMCRLLRVKRASYYAWHQREQTGPTAHAQQDATLALAVTVAFGASHDRYGSPRLLPELQAMGHCTSRKRIARLMRAQGLRARAPRRYRVTTNSRHGEPVAPNVLDRQFDAPAYAQPNRAWVSDFTYIATHEGWLYCAVVLDLASRRVVGWALRDRMDTALTLDALRMALAQRRPAPGWVHHSDRGVQYATRAYRQLLAQHGGEASMSRTGNCWDNAVAESFFATLRRELGGPEVWPTRHAARGALVAFIDGWYNRTRRHSRLGYRSPVAYEAALRTA
jgi:transposase InsO family protein